MMSGPINSVSQKAAESPSKKENGGDALMEKEKGEGIKDEADDEGFFETNGMEEGAGQEKCSEAMKNGTSCVKKENVKEGNTRLE